jgi:hypothetical protein
MDIVVRGESRSIIQFFHRSPLPVADCRYMRRLHAVEPSEVGTRITRKGFLLCEAPSCVGSSGRLYCSGCVLEMLAMMFQGTPARLSLQRHGTQSTMSLGRSSRMLVEMHLKLQGLTALIWVTHDYAFAMDGKVRGRRAKNDGFVCPASCRASAVSRPQNGVKQANGWRSDMQPRNSRTKLRTLRSTCNHD